MAKMFKDRPFQVAFLISLSIHGFLFAKLPKIAFPVHKNFKDLKITYCQVKRTPKLEPLPKKIPLTKRKLVLKSSQEGFPSWGRIELKPIQLQKKPLPLKEIEGKKKIDLPLDKDKLPKNPKYLSYYQLIREKIRHCAYHYYTRYVEGEVHLGFTILSDGSLKEAKIYEAKSTPNFFLRKIALRSVKEACPYPAFPKELNYPQLSFNVIISFEIED